MLSCLLGIDFLKKKPSNFCDFLSVANRYLSLFKQRAANLQTFWAYFKGCTKKNLCQVFKGVKGIFPMLHNKSTMK